MRNHIPSDLKLVFSSVVSVLVPVAAVPCQSPPPSMFDSSVSHLQKPRALFKPHCAQTSPKRTLEHRCVLQTLPFLPRVPPAGVTFFRLDHELCRDLCPAPLPMLKMPQCPSRLLRWTAGSCFSLSTFRFKRLMSCMADMEWSRMGGGGGGVICGHFTLVMFAASPCLGHAWCDGRSTHLLHL